MTLNGYSRSRKLFRGHYLANDDRDSEYVRSFIGSRMQSLDTEAGCQIFDRKQKYCKRHDAVFLRQDGFLV